MRATIGAGHDHILVFAKNILQFKQKLNILDQSEDQLSRYKNPDKDPKGPWISADFMAKGFRPNQMYEIITPSGKKYIPRPGSCWRNIEPVYKNLLSEGRIWFGKDGDSIPRKKTYLSESTGIAAWTWWPNSEVGHNQEAKKECNALFGMEDTFETPKPERLLKRILHLASNPGDLVLDSFAGSGTTGAVAHKMGRRWIMCELGEHCHTHIIPRMKKVIDGTDQGGISESANWKGGGGFKYYHLAESLLVRDKELSTKDHPVYTINPRYNEQMLIKAICKIENFKYRNTGRLHGISSESRFLHVTTRLINQAYIDSLAEDLAPNQSLLIYSTRRMRGLKLPDNIELKKIPRDLLEKCDFQEDKK